MSSGYYFETTASIQEQERKSRKSKNKAGSPIKLPSKPLAVRADPTNDERVFVAESSGTARRIRLDTKDTSHTFAGPKSTPLTCLALNSAGTVLFAGSWDQSIWSWDIASRKPGRRYYAHSDFVKAVECFHLPLHPGGGEEVIISGGADQTIVVQTLAGEKLHIIRDEGMKVLSLAVSRSAEGMARRGLTIYVGSSDPIVRRFFVAGISPDRANDRDEAPVKATGAHETSVNAVALLDPPKADIGADMDPLREKLAETVWTASSDGTVKCLDRATLEPQMTLRHEQGARSLALTGQYIVTAGRSEDVCVWDVESGEQVCTWQGHFDEIHGLAVIRGGMAVVSASVDCTIRCWSLEDDDMNEVMDNEGETMEDDEEESKKEVTLDSDEERELAELMGDDTG